MPPPWSGRDVNRSGGLPNQPTSPKANVRVDAGQLQYLSALPDRLCPVPFGRPEQAETGNGVRLKVYRAAAWRDAGFGSFSRLDILAMCAGPRPHLGRVLTGLGGGGNR